MARRCLDGSTRAGSGADFLEELESGRRIVPLGFTQPVAANDVLSLVPEHATDGRKNHLVNFSRFHCARAISQVFDVLGSLYDVGEAETKLGRSPF
jgi:hypothetical protein